MAIREMSNGRLKPTHVPSLLAQRHPRLELPEFDQVHEPIKKLKLSGTYAGVSLRHRKKTVDAVLGTRPRLLQGNNFLGFSGSKAALQLIAHRHQLVDLLDCTPLLLHGWQRNPR